MAGTEPGELSTGQVRALREAVGRGSVLLDPRQRRDHAGDRSVAEPVLPAAVCRPTSADAVAALLQVCARERLPVTPRGAGTGKAGGCVPSPGGVVCSLEGLAGVERLSTADQQVEVGAGTVTGDVRAAVEAEGLFYPPDPASLDECTIGGNVATNAGGPLCVKYGVTGDYVMGLEAVLADGRRVRVGRRTIKGVAGYDLRGLLVGSEGTLAVITAVTLRLLPRPSQVRTAWLTFSSASRACEAVAAVLRAGLLPRALELLDAPALSERADGQAALLLEVDGPPGTGDAQLTAAMEVAAARAETSRVAETEAQVRELWELRRTTSAALKAPFAHHLSEDVAVPTGQLASFLHRLDDLRGEGTGITIAAYGHAGDGNLHVNLLYDDPDLGPAVRRMAERVFRIALELGGTITGEHGIGLLKRPYLPWEQPEKLLELQRRIKRAFDPAGVLNPGKVLSG